MRHWKEDFLFGYQFLNGCNPVMIEKCTKLPHNLPVTNEMVCVSLQRGLTLEEEIKVDQQTQNFHSSSTFTRVQDICDPDDPW